MAVITDFRTYLKAYYDLWATATGTNYKDAEIKKETLDKLYGLHNLFVLAGRDAEYDTALTFYQEMLTLLGVAASDVAWDVTTANLATLFGTTTAVTIPQDNIFWWNDVESWYEPYLTKGSGGEFYAGTSSPSAATRLNYNGVFATTGQILPSIAAPAAPVEGQRWNDSTQKAMIEYVSGIKQYATNMLFIQTADQWVANTTTETTVFGTGVGTHTLPANFFTIGKTLRIIIRGTMAGTNGDTATIKIKIGATTLVSSVAAMPATINGAEFEADFLLTCRTTGVTGTIIGQGSTKIIVTTGISTSYSRQLYMDSSAVVDTTVSNLLDATYQWSAARVGNALRSTNCFVRVEM